MPYLTEKQIKDIKWKYVIIGGIIGMIFVRIMMWIVP